MSTQPVATEIKPPRPRAKAVGGSRSKRPTPTRSPVVLHPFDRALAASLQRRAEVVHPVAAGCAPLPEAAAPSSRLRALLGGWAQSCKGLLAGLNARRVAQGGRRLRMVERVSLGEKQAVAILAVQGVQYLVGHGPGGISLLARLDEQAGEAVAAPPGEVAQPSGLTMAKLAKGRAERLREQARATQ